MDVNPDHRVELLRDRKACHALHTHRAQKRKHGRLGQPLGKTAEGGGRLDARVEGVDGHRHAGLGVGLRPLRNPLDLRAYAGLKVSTYAVKISYVRHC